MTYLALLGRRQFISSEIYCQLKYHLRLVNTLEAGKQKVFEISLRNPVTDCRMKYKKPMRGYMKEFGSDFIKENFGSLQVTRISLKVEFQKPSRDRDTTQNGLVPIFGSAWRGLLGWELQDLACPMPRKRECDKCLILKLQGTF